MRLLVGIFIFFISLSAFGQDSLAPTKNNKLFLHYYPSNLLTGDISFGAEHLYKKRFAQEFSVNIKCFESFHLHYDRGYRFNYLAKYNITNSTNFRFSILASTFYRNINFKNKIIDYYESVDVRTPSTPIVMTLVEDRVLEEFGMGTGLSFNLRVHKQFFIGSDILFNLVYTNDRRYIKKIITPPSYPLIPELSAPSQINYDRRNIVPYLTFKLSYQIW